jgi:hypothetical protein
MSTIAPSISASLVALQALTPPSVSSPRDAVLAPPPPALTGSSRTMLAPSAADAVLGLNTIAPKTQAVAAAAASDAYARESIPAEKIDWLNSLGADAWSPRKPASLDDAAFEQQALARMNRSGTSKLPGFAEARENGTLKVRRASEMPELGYRSYQLTLYREGAEFGGAAFNTIDADRWMALRQSGTFAATGSVDGNDYIATWPLAWNDATEQQAA